MEIKTSVVVDVFLADGSEPLPEQTEEIHDSIGKYMRKGIHDLAISQDVFKYTVGMTQTEIVDKETQ